MASAGPQGGDPSARVFVGNLDWKISWQDLKDHMRSAGEVVYAHIFKQDGRSKGCAVVEYKTREDAQTAIDTLNDSQLGERLIFVREDREEGQSSKGFKGGGGGKGGGYGGGYGKGKGDGYSKGKSKGGFGFGGNIAPLRTGPRDKGRIVVAGNLPYRVAWQEVKDVFKAYGDVIRVDVAQDADGSYATILFERADEAQVAIESLNDTEFQGRMMAVKMDDSV